MPDIPTDGLPLADRCRLAVSAFLLGGLSPMAALRVHWHVIRAHREGRRSR
jgi:hypothetical protein